jgi:large subunit ribosomal protein L19e
MNINAQKRLASEILKCGTDRVYFHPESIEDVSMAITREDVRNLIKSKVITKRYKKGISRIRANEQHKRKQKGRSHGYGSRKGKRNARSPAKRIWINHIRPQRHELRILRDTNRINVDDYRQTYLKAKGGAFSSVASMHRYLEENKLLRKR